MTDSTASAAPRCTEEQLVREVHNADRVPFRAMSESVQSVLCVEWKAVEWYSRDACAWVPNPNCPRQWNDEAYRVPPSVFPNAQISGGIPYAEADCSVCHAKIGHHDDPHPHHCLLPAGHDGRHFCHICGLYWDTPNESTQGRLPRKENHE